MSETMKIWNQVCATDPSHTKKVNQRGGFTAIDAHYQVMNATKQFGPVGEGWGYDCQPPVFHDKFVIVPVVLWHAERSNTFGPIYGCAEMLGNRPDADAPKKATTDAITKGLSQLGFNADVFLGKFDDNKYVEKRRKEESEASQPSDEEKAAKRKETAQKIAKEIENANGEFGASEVIHNRLEIITKLHNGDFQAYQIIADAAGMAGAEITIHEGKSA